MSEEDKEKSDAVAPSEDAEPDPRILAGLDAPRGVRTKAASASSGYVIFSPLWANKTFHSNPLRAMSQ